MRLQKVYGMGLGATLSLALIACGGGPDIDQVKADFENPSGSTKDKNAVISASSQAGASSSVRILGAAGVPGQGLTAKGKLRAFSELSMIERYAPFAERELYRLTKNETRALRTSDFIDSCDAAAFEEASQELQNELGLDLAFGGSSASADATFTIDLSSCPDNRLTGSVEITMEVEFSERRFAYRVTEELRNVCETDGARACLDGTLVMEAEATGDAMGEAGELTFVVAWDVDGTWEEGGATRSASVRGGVRTIFGGDGTSGYGSVEYLVYARNADGDEFSFVYQVSAEWDGVGGGSGTLLIRGSDGQLECTYTAEMVTCTGDADISWTPDEEITLSGAIYGG